MSDEIQYGTLNLPDGKEIKYLVNGLKYFGFKSIDPFFDERLFKYFEEMNSKLEYLKVKPGDIMIDVGASVGSWSIYAAIYGCKVYAFEVGQPQLKTLDFNARFNDLRDLIIIYDCALDSSDDTSLTFDELMGLKKSDKAEVSSLSFDTWVNQHRDELPRIDYMKIDVEGMEFEVLRGAYHTLKEFRPKLIIEIHDVGNPILRHDIENFLKDLGYNHKHIPGLNDYFF